MVPEVEGSTPSVHPMNRPRPAFAGLFLGVYIKGPGTGVVFYTPLLSPSLLEFVWAHINSGWLS